MGIALAQLTEQTYSGDPLLTAEDVAERLKVSRDWVWGHSSRRLPYLPVIRMSDGALPYRASQIEAASSLLFGRFRFSVKFNPVMRMRHPQRFKCGIVFSDHAWRGC